jgi:hypothetical protein
MATLYCDALLVQKRKESFGSENKSVQTNDTARTGIQKKTQYIRIKRSVLHRFILFVKHFTKRNRGEHLTID